MKYFSFLIFVLFYLNTNAQLINDQSYIDLSFHEFKSKLFNAIIKKDTVKLKEFLADNIYESKDLCGYPGCDKNTFIKYYFRENADKTWSDMNKIVRFGFYKVNDSSSPKKSIKFQGPSYLKNINPDTEVIILGENVNIREKPSLNAKVLKIVSFEKLKCDCSILTMKKATYQNIDGINWLEVKFDFGKVGYVSAKLTSYELIKEMTIKKIKGKWKIISFFNEPGC